MYSRPKITGSKSSQGRGRNVTSSTIAVEAPSFLVVSEFLERSECMDAIIEFFKSDLGVSISWICTVVSTGFCFFKAKENKSLKVQVKGLEIKVNNLGDDTVTQSGDGNVYTKQNSGGMKINM